MNEDKLQSMDIEETDNFNIEQYLEDINNVLKLMIKNIQKEFIIIIINYIFNEKLSINILKNYNLINIKKAKEIINIKLLATSLYSTNKYRNIDDIHNLNYKINIDILYKDNNIIEIIENKYKYLINIDIFFKWIFSLYEIKLNDDEKSILNKHNNLMKQLKNYLRNEYIFKNKIPILCLIKYTSNTFIWDIKKIPNNSK